MSFPKQSVVCLMALFALVVGESPWAQEPNTLVPDGRTVYAAGPLPDRILLMPGADAARQASVAWRTEGGDLQTVAEIVEAVDSPTLALHARSVSGSHRALTSDNGRALHHRVDFTDLQPDTLYAYRVRGHDTWSEWLHLRTPPAQATPFRFIYLGDAQNRIRSQVSRVIRQAWLDAPDARAIVHAGDLVNTRIGNHDDEWAEWFAAGGPNLAMIPSVAAAGNHEYRRSPLGRYQGLAPHWPAQFPVPGNGAEGLSSTTYFVDLMDVRFVVMDTTAALEKDGLAAQTSWLGSVLTGHDQRWTVVVQHHPMTSVYRGRDNAPLREHWQPLFDRHRVDLILQGHDHAYGRRFVRIDSEETPGHGSAQLVSIAGSKQYSVSDAARRVMQRVGEDIQLYQIISVDADRLQYRSRTVTGRSYDAFDLVRDEHGRNQLVEIDEGQVPERRCPDRTADRCRP